MGTLELVLMVLLGGVVAAAGVWIMRSTRGTAPEPLARPQPIAHTDAHGQARIVERYVYLALELARVDGAIVDTEIAAIETSMGEPPVEVVREDAARRVHNALRATIRQPQVGAALQEIARHADTPHRQWVLRALEAVARADGTINREEDLFLDRVRQELG